MKFTPKEYDSEASVPEESQLKQFFIFALGLFGIIAAIYFILGFAVDLIVPHLPYSVEESLGKHFGVYENYVKSTPAEQKLQKMVDELASYAPELAGRKFTVILSPSPHVNALAAPGGRIIVLSGLLKKVKTENELAYVLAHELGHFAHKDHLKGFGRGIVLYSLIALVSGANSGAADFVARSVSGLQLKYTRDQEKAADIFSVDLIQKKYANTSGVKNLLAEFGKMEKMPKYVYFFATHPCFEDRIHAVEQYKKKMGYKDGKEKPLPKVLREVVPVEGKKENVKFGF